MGYTISAAIHGAIPKTKLTRNMGAANFKGVSISTVMDDKSFRRLCVTLGCLTGPQWRVTGTGAFGCAPGQPGTWVC